MAMILIIDTVLAAGMITVSLLIMMVKMTDFGNNENSNNDDNEIMITKH